MQDARKNLPVSSMARIIAGGRKSESRSGSLLRRKKRKRSKLLRKG